VPIPRPTRATLPTWLFAAAVVVTGPLLLFHYGAYHWFLRDDWSFIADRDGFPDLFEPHGGSHLVAVPRLIYLGLWEVFGITTYRPYQVLVVLTHLVTAVLLRIVMLRAGVRPWLALAAASLFLLVGPGAVNTVWAFQVGFNGSLAWGLGHLLLADHDGRFDRRDALGLACGLLAITSSGVGVSITVGVGLAVLLRRGWKAALLHTAPLAVLYGAWSLLAGARTDGPFGRPPVDVLWSWTRSSAIGAFDGIGRFQLLAAVFVLVLVVGMVLTWGPGRDRDLRALCGRLSMPIGLAVAAIFFVVTTGMVRAWSGPSFARGLRYVYLEAALLLPLLAVSAEAVARRWRTLTPALVGLFLLPIPFNLLHFETGVFNDHWMDNREFVLTTAVRMPFAGDVPRDVQPAPDAAASDAVTIGFLLTAAKNGDLTPSTVPLTPEVVNEFKVRLGVAQRFRPGPVSDCRTYDKPIVLDPELGDVFYLGSGVTMSTFEDRQRTSRGVVLQPAEGGTQVTIELPDLSLWVGPTRLSPTFTLCEKG